MNHYRSIFISDIHLGTRGSKAKYLIDFLRNNDSENLFLVGDIIDGWRLKSQWYWPTEHSTIVQKILRASRKGTKVRYIIGNHDEFLRDYLHFGLSLGDIEMFDEYIHVTADGKKIWIVHGDAYDQVVKYVKWLAILGDAGYELLLRINGVLNWLRRHFGLHYWSMSAYVKNKVKGAVNFIGDFENTLAHEARKRNLDGVLCGHIHHSAIKDINGIKYFNTGDWVESCTAIVEHFNGEFEIIQWHEITHKS